MSCALSEAMGNNGKLITVEADPEVWDIHQVNIWNYNKVITGTLINQVITLIDQSYHWHSINQVGSGRSLVGSKRLLCLNVF